MSSGPGIVQRTILAVLDEKPRGRHSGWTTMSELAGSAFDTVAPTRAQVESVRRAAKALHARGLVELDYMPELVNISESQHRRRFYGDRVQLFAHLKLSVEDREAVERWLETLPMLDDRVSR